MLFEPPSTPPRQQHQQQQQSHSSSPLNSSAAASGQVSSSRGNRRTHSNANANANPSTTQTHRGRGSGGSGGGGGGDASMSNNSRSSSSRHRNRQQQQQPPPTLQLLLRNMNNPTSNNSDNSSSNADSSVSTLQPQVKLVKRPQSSSSSNTTTLAAPRPASSSVAPSRLPLLRRVVAGAGKPPSPSVKILDHFLKLHADAAYKFLTDRPGCYIVGILGKQGVGKTTLARALVGGGAGNNNTSRNNSASAIELTRSPEGLVVLDTCPIFSRSVYDRYKQNVLHDYSSSSSSSSSSFGNSESSPTIVTTDPLLRYPELWMENFSTQIATLIFSICHLVILVTDDTDPSSYDPSLIQFLKQVEKSINTGGTGNHNSSEPSRQQDSDSLLLAPLPPPQFLLVANKQPTTSFEPAVFKARMQQLAVELGKSGGNGRRLCNWDSNNRLGLSRAYPKRYGEAGTSATSSSVLPSIFALPLFTTTSTTSPSTTTTTTGTLVSSSTSSSVPDRYPILLQKLYTQILEIPRFNTGNNNIMMMSEREWFRLTAKCADGLRRTHLMNSARVGRDESARQGRGRVFTTIDKG